ncbi:MAG: hypothetical protein JWL84_6268 [Rhodospirillales bacterium]|nr:hypothetical protein [Rhodospirillales bacterium]
MSASDLGYWAVLVVGGLACGLINTLASSGSAVSLPLLVALGISDGVANATNRLPVLVGGLMASWTFARQHEVDWRAALVLAPPALIGSILGVRAAEMLGNREMGLLITGAVMLALLLLFTKVKAALSRVLGKPPKVTFDAVLLMFVVGLWLGLIVLDGATYLMLVLMLVCRYQLAPANALKSIILAVTTLVPVALFWEAGDILWTEGIVMAGGSVGGGHIGALLSSHERARAWTFYILVAVISLELVHLLWHYAASLRLPAL